MSNPKIANAPLQSFAVHSDTVAGAACQYVKLDIGAVGASSPVTASNPIPTTQGSNSTRWFSQVEFNAPQSNSVLKAAPGAGLALSITKIIVSIGATAGTVKFVYDTAGTPTVVIPTMYFSTNGGITLTFDQPLKLNNNVNFGFTSTLVTTHSIFVQGIIE